MGRREAASLSLACHITPSTQVERTKDAKNDLLELYCGNGCFTVALAPNFRRVVATEVAKPSVALARDNLALNGVTNATVARLSAEEFVEAQRDGDPTMPAP